MRSMYDEETRKCMGERIAAARRSYVRDDGSVGLTAEELARLLRKSRSAVQTWEAGKAAPRREQLLALSKLFGKPPCWFLGDNDDGEKQTEPKRRMVLRPRRGGDALMDLLIESYSRTPDDSTVAPRAAHGDGSDVFGDWAVGTADDGHDETAAGDAADPLLEATKRFLTTALTYGRGRTSAFPGITALLADEAVCAAMGVTDGERELLQECWCAPFGPETVQDAVALLDLLRRFSARREEMTCSGPGGV